MHVDPSMQPVHDQADALTQAGQRKINLIWEYTQAAIAIAVTVTALVAVTLAAFLPVNGSIAVGALIFVTNAFSLVIGAYFQRTNHNKIGGIGRNLLDEQKYVGR